VGGDGRRYWRKTKKKGTGIGGGAFSGKTNCVWLIHQCDWLGWEKTGGSSAET